MFANPRFPFFFFFFSGTVAAFAADRKPGGGVYGKRALNKKEEEREKEEEEKKSKKERGRPALHYKRTTFLVTQLISLASRNSLENTPSPLFSLHTCLPPSAAAAGIAAGCDAFMIMYPMPIMINAVSTPTMLRTFISTVISPRVWWQAVLHDRHL